MTIRVGLAVLFFCLRSWALVPVEGLILGVAREDLQNDPLALVFSDNFDRSKDYENSKIKLYHNALQSGINLSENCGPYGPSAYGYPWQEQQARRSMAATLQYLGLDYTIKAIGTYAKKLEVGEGEFRRLSSNLIKNYCSKNITVFSLRNIERSLEHYYKTPLFGLIPSIKDSPFATEEFRNRTEKDSSRSVELDYAVRSFRSFCSWGGDTTDYRLLGPYLKNPFIMALVIKHMLGLQDSFDPKLQKVALSESDNTVQVNCTELICRKVDQEVFIKKFPTSIGSTGLKTDLSKLYCNHFRYMDYVASSSVPQIKKWIKESDLEDPVYETGHFLSLITGVPDPMYSTEKYADLPFLAKSSIDERWKRWAGGVMSLFSKDLMYEESLKIRAMPLRDPTNIRLKGFRLDFRVTVGEMDRIMDDTDKLSAFFHIKVSKNYLRAARVKWSHLLNEVDIEGQKSFKKDMASYLGLQLKNKEKLFLQKMWNQEFSRLMADELLEQALVYKGALFDSYQEEVLTIPVELHYGLFALSYLRFRADVNAGRRGLGI